MEHGGVPPVELSVAALSLRLYLSLGSMGVSSSRSTRQQRLVGLRGCSVS